MFKKLKTIFAALLHTLLKGLANVWTKMPNVTKRSSYQKLNEENSKEEEDGVDVSTSTNNQHVIRSARIRNLVAYWLLGLTNNYAFVVMLSAAHDILSTQWGNSGEGQHTTPATIESDSSNETTNNTVIEMNCNTEGTAAILLADVLPSLIIKSLSTFLPAYTHFRITMVVVLNIASFTVTSFSKAYWQSFLGVVCASLASGLGEITFIGYAAFFDKDVISTWSSGTGGAGLFGALSYMALTQAGVTPRTSLLIMLFVPVLMVISFWVILVHPPGLTCNGACCQGSSLIKEKESSSVVFVASRNLSDDSSDNAPIEEHKQENRPVKKNCRADGLTLKKKFNIIKKIFFPLMFPLALVYISEYFINQALMEILYFRHYWLTPAEQYRWYQADYQLGVLISRSSVNFVTIRKIWILGILQVLNVAILLFQVFCRFIPSFWIIIVLIFYEGLLGGSAYVNTFYRISKEMEDEEKEYALSITTVSDSCGVALAGAIGIPSHRALCALPYKKS